MGAEGRRLVVPGGSGFLGRIVARWFAGRLLAEGFRFESPDIEATLDNLLRATRREQPR